MRLFFTIEIEPKNVRIHGVYRTLPQDQQWTSYIPQQIKCDNLGNLCFFYIVMSEKERQFIVVFRGTNKFLQITDEALQSLGPGVPFFNIGKV